MSQPYSALPLVRLPANYHLHKLSLLASMAERHGPIFQVEWSSSYRPVYMVGPEANRFVMQTHREHFSHDLGWTPQIGELFGKGLLNMDPPEHTVHRRLMNPAFTYTYMARYLPIMARVIAERCRDWAVRGEVDLYAEARKITFDVAAEALVGLPTGPEVDLLRELFYAMLGGGPADESEAQFYTRLTNVRSELGARLAQLIAARRGRSDAEQTDILGVLVNARDEEGTMLSDAHLLGHVNILLVAGHETSTTLSAWLLYLLATHPAELARVRAELDTLLPNPDSPLSHEAIKAMRLLGNALSEAGRIYPPVAMVPRGVVAPFEFAGCRVPAGTALFLAIGASHYLPAIFPEPQRFDPDRFAAPREEDKRTPYGLATFGGGPRICIGVNFAQVEIRAFAAHVLRRYDLTPLAPDEVQQIYPGLVGAPANGIRVRVTPRA